jgi:hypothetical protein
MPFHVVAAVNDILDRGYYAIVGRHFEQLRAVDEVLDLARMFDASSSVSATLMLVDEIRQAMEKVDR